jgi:nicotinamide phosphoribosyltransferase
MLYNKSLMSMAINQDSYKVSMPRQYPPNTENIFSYIESRGGEQEQLFLGLQGFVKQYLLKPITKKQIDFAEKFWKIHGEPFDRTPWDIVINEYNGFLPLTIRAVDEGTVLPTKNILVSVELTEDDSRLIGLVTTVETSLLRAVWYPTTVGTQSWKIKQIIKKFLETSGDVTGLPFKLHDFGARGVSSYESAEIGAFAHLVNFMGTDTVAGIMYASENYDAQFETIGFSIPASEHSTITSWGRPHEKEAYVNMLRNFAKPGAIFACVSDSYNIYDAARMWVTLKDEIISSGATLVIRPDSGDPLSVIPKLINILQYGFTDTSGKIWEGFPLTENAKSFKVLQQVRIIWGDGIDQQAISSILRTMVNLYGWSADMFAFGMGGALLQGVNRDNLRFAMKCSSAKINGKWVDVYKDPVDDPGKRSKSGRLALIIDPITRVYSTVAEDWMPNQLTPVYINGKLMKNLSLSKIRENSEK